MHLIQKMAVFCGSSEGNNEQIKNDADTLGKLMAEAQIELIYGGGGIGLMGRVANAVLSNGGKVTGVIPDFLSHKEVMHPKVADMIRVPSMHERKQIMYDRCDAVVALPGGFGTLDELFETLTWSQLGLHAKPIGLLNSSGFFKPLIEQVNNMIEFGFLKQDYANLFCVADTPAELLQKIHEFEPVQRETWLHKSQV